jgi:serine/threonine protein kinase
MAPEAFENDARLTPVSDIFSFGILAYELITGVKPFHCDSVPGMMKAIQESRPPKPEKYVHGLPHSVEDFLAKLLKKNPEERYQDMKQVINGINVILGNGQISGSVFTNTLKQIFNIQKDWE